MVVEDHRRDGSEKTRGGGDRSEEHTSELQSRPHLVCRLLLEKKNKIEKRVDRTMSQEDCLIKGCMRVTSVVTVVDGAVVPLTPVRRSTVRSATLVATTSHSTT